MGLQRERDQEAAHGLHGPSSPMPPTQPELSVEPSGHRRRSTLEDEVRYHPTLMLRVAVVVPLVSHPSVPTVQGWQETLREEFSVS